MNHAILNYFQQLDMPKEHILDNVRVVIQDVASHKPAEFGESFITAVADFFFLMSPYKRHDQFSDN